jgi:hypothetical protein
VDESGREVAPPRSQGGRFRRPQGKRRPVYYDDYYDYDYQEYYDAPANEEEDPASAGNGTTTANKPAKPQQEVRNRVSRMRLSGEKRKILRVKSNQNF